MLNVVSVEINVALMKLALRMDTPVVEMQDRVDRPIRSAVLTAAAAPEGSSVVVVGIVVTQLLAGRIAVEISTLLGTCSGAIFIRLFIQRK
jgi:hypothetical protein